MRPLFGALVVLGAAAASLQTGAPKEVIVNVVAADRHGRPVTDLSRSDFKVLDDGKEEAITSFQRYEDKGPHALLILLDILNTQFGPRGRAVGQIATALERLKSPESVYLYVLSSDGALKAVHAMPDKPAQGEGVLWTRSIRDQLSRVIADTNNMRPEYLRSGDTRAKITYRSLSAVAAPLARFPGRKAMVWVTHGVPLTADSDQPALRVDYEPVLQRLAAALGAADIAGYPVAQAAESGVPSTTYSRSSFEALTLFADLTGGRKYPTDHIDEAITQALADGRTGYRVGFRPGSGRPDSEYRNIRVVCARSGVRVQSRQGYYPTMTRP